MSDNTNNQGGFTLVELSVTMTVFAIMATGLIAVLMSFYASMMRNSVIADMTATSQSFLRTTVEHIRYGAGVRQNNLLTDPNSPAGGWNTGNTNFVIVIAVPAETASRDYIIDPSTGKPYQNELIYYKSGKTLMQRTLANTSAVGNRTKTSCPPASATTSCPADKQLLNKLATISFTFYDQDNDLTTDPTLARSVAIDLTNTVDTFGQPLNLSNNIQVTLRNTF